MELVTLIQGTPEWQAHRAKHLNASDAPAMMGVSPYVTRSELIKRLATGITPEVDQATQRIFDNGHRFEGLALPLAEEIVGDDMSNCVGVNGKFSASFDGLNFDGDVAFEHKTLSKRLREAMFDGCTGTDLPMDYAIQMEHQCMVGDKIGRVLFMASEWTGDGALIEERHCWYTPNPELRAQIVAGWEQLEKDVAAYTPTAEPVVLPTAKVRDALPVLRIEARGEITASNLEDFKAVVLERINSVNTELATDQEFADADADGKWLRDVAGKMAQAIQMVRSNIQPVDAVLVVLEQLQDIATKKAIAVEKLVKTEKDVRKEKIVTEAQNELAVHIDAINKQLGAAYLQAPQGIFAPVIKGLKSISSMQDKVRAALAQAIGDANATALRLRTNRDHLKQDGSDWVTLFPDFGVVGTRPAEDFQALAALRIGQHKEAENKRLEAERERIRAEEQAKADAAMRAELIKKEQEAQAGIAEARKAEALPAPLLDALSDTAAFVRAEAVSAIDAQTAIQSAKRSATDDGARIALGQIKELIAPLSIDAAGLAQLGFPHVATDKSSKLYRACDFEAIRAAMIQHLQGVDIAHPLTA